LGSSTSFATRDGLGGTGTPHGDLGPPRPPCRAARSPPGRSSDVEQSTQNWL
jgi:hypothetical protein